ncbi:MAG: hypothetical protein AAF242_19970, partial [Bacteroidota bacterium]
MESLRPVILFLCLSFILVSCEKDIFNRPVRLQISVDEGIFALDDSLSIRIIHEMRDIDFGLVDNVKPQFWVNGAPIDTSFFKP